jgi:hypothetical protein
MFLVFPRPPDCGKNAAKTRQKRGEKKQGGLSKFTVVKFCSRNEPFFCAYAEKKELWQKRELFIIFSGYNYSPI